jgi:hypothetical protein
MRQIIVRYDGQCARCNADLLQGAIAMYERSTGMFCVGCEPTSTEDIRAVRLAKAERKAERYEEWAEKREVKAATQLNSHRDIRHDPAFNTQPGHIPFRARMLAADKRACESLAVAARMRGKAVGLRQLRVAGDAEPRRQRMREALDKLITKGGRVVDAVFGEGEVIAVYKKSYRIKFDGGYTYARDKSFVRPGVPRQQRVSR